jgi:hypothetical protein
VTAIAILDLERADFKRGQVGRPFAFLEPFSKDHP